MHVSDERRGVRVQRVESPYQLDARRASSPAQRFHKRGASRGEKRPLFDCMLPATTNTACRARDIRLRRVIAGKLVRRSCSD